MTDRIVADFHCENIPSNCAGWFCLRSREKSCESSLFVYF